MSLPMSIQECVKYDYYTGLFTKHDLPTGSEFKNKCGARYINIFCAGKSYKAHRLAWEIYYNEAPIGDIDHIDGDGTNNSIKNLRLVNKSINQRNQKLSSRNNSGIAGVLWRDNINKYEVTATVNKEKFNLGYFNNIFEAVCVRKSFNNKNGFTLRHG